jgi:hypothetical protein
LARLTWTTPAFGEYLNAERAFFRGLHRRLDRQTG